MDLMDTTLTPLEGGWSGRTFLAETGAERTVVRIYPPEEARGRSPRVDAALLRLVRGLLPVPDVLEVREAVPELDQPGLLVTAWVEGRRGDQALLVLGREERAHMGAALGHVAGVLAGVPTLRSGLFLDGDLAIKDFEPDLSSWVLDLERSAEGWDPDMLRGLHDVVDAAREVAADVERTCLVHSDLNPKNVLVDDTGAIVAVLDWEFAHSGSPWTDLGNVLRFDREPAYVEAALGAYCSLRGGVPEEHLERARAADLWALVDLAARPAGNPVTARATDLLRTIAQQRDLHAWPEGW